MADISFDRGGQDNPLASFLGNNWRTLIAAVVAALLAVGGYAAYTSYAKKAKAQAENDLGAIIASKTGPERLSALEAYVKTAPASTKDAALLELARTAAEQGNHAKAAEAWNQLALAAPGGVKDLAVLGQASALAQAGDKAQAVKLLADFMPKAPKAFQPLVARQLAAVAEDAQAWTEALAAYERLREAAEGGNKALFEAKITEIKAKTK
ncbi:hypothetical protein NNJEOMEG_02124 [Fundidesulfovibrio magnetotacticus]|uniref:Ancillary SecYEG translocon subunit/Cell division coordinator CpoB TPR domain-containing protein n=1 Tax=Fundidesulfovibrio magnetotacticus TaxID=2730080 RepID=A0A6V8LNV8_9BACT|nr:tetratricopeptide repeat protein [Fundidesulfovibrio magnetotacticus]GFK94282.1 hypothetical protein NNJEOMEG_02124 [Fundidesulfovibrio magnetotacticus]